MNNKIISKVFTTTLIMFFVLTIYTLPTIKKEEKVLRTNLEIEDIASIPSNKIYLLNKNNLLTQTDIFINSKEIEEQVKEIINYLTINNTNIPVGLNSYIPTNTKVLNILIEDDILKIDFSKELLETDKLDIVITGITYSILEIDGINNLSLTVENNSINNLKILNKNIGINNKYEYTSRKDIDRTVIYYLDNINKEYYFIPVTKYLNDPREKIEIIVDQLKNNCEDELISPINNKIALLDYREEANVLYLNFNKYLQDENEEITKKVEEIIAYSVFDNYDVHMVMFEVNGKEVNYIKR